VCFVWYMSECVLCVIECVCVCLIMCDLERPTMSLTTPEMGCCATGGGGGGCVLGKLTKSFHKVKR
jgi:hypothetical protein